jgi:type I restriction enzyme S subunit
MNRISCKLSELVEVKNGSTPSTKRNDFYDGNIVWITPKDLSINKSKFIYSSERKITKAGFDSCSTSLLPIGSVLLSSRAPIGLLAICAIETCTNQGFKNLVLKKDKLHNEYLYYWLKTKVKYIDSLGTGTTFKEVSKGVIENLSIEIPKDIKDQQKIASVLSALDSKIELNNRINAELEAMAKTLYDYWFVQFDFPDENGKPYKTSGGKMVWNEELKREIPVGWEVKKIKSIIEVKDGTHDSPKPKSKGYRLITSKNLQTAGLDFNNANFISEEDYLSIIKRSNVETGDILFSMIGNIGTVYKIEEKEINFAIKNVALFKTSKMQEHKNYVFMFLKSIDMDRYMKNVISGSIQKFIGLNSLRETPILSNEVLIRKYNEITFSIFEKLENLKRENQKLTELRDWLLPMLMNGQVKVN